jgi:hypothetical protein
MQTFTAKDDKGQEYTIHVYPNPQSGADTEHPDAVIMNVPRMVTAEGDVVEYLEQGRYYVPALGVFLFSNAPDPIPPAT